MSQDLCSDCVQALASWSFESSSNQQYHHPDIKSLSKSAQTCGLCQILLENLCKDDKEEIMAAADSGSYSKVVIHAGDPGLQPQLKDALGPGTALFIEISTKNRAIRSRDSIILPPNSTLNRRAIWNCVNPIPFDLRVPVIHEWIKECTETHARCRRANSEDGNYLPTRAIAVGPAGATVVKLLVTGSENLTKSPEGRRYAALSHCWGHPPPKAMLTRENFVEWQSSMDVQSLPKTFQDAIHIAQKLLIPYLWIDCMCIIQNDLDSRDWQEQAACMAEIYRNAYVTFGAASSFNSNEGCFIDTPMLPLIQKFTLGIEAANGLQDVMIRPNFHEESILGPSCLHTRGWIFQEQILSRRTIYFTRSQMFWQCHRKQHSEDALGDGPKVCLKTAFLGQYALNKGTRTPDEVWWTWVSEYTVRDFKYFSDRLPALAGVSKLYQEKTGDIPLVGLWTQNLYRNLLWRCELQSSRNEHHKYPDTNGCPSWSWVATNGAILPPEDMHRVQKERELQTPPYVHTVVVTHDLEWSSIALSSPLKKASITLFGPLMEMKDYLELVPPQEKLECKLTHHYSQRRRYPARLFNKDFPVYDKPFDESDLRCALTKKAGTSEISLDYKLPESTNIFGLLMYSSMVTGTEHILLVSPVDLGLKRFRRLGIAEHSHSSIQLVELVPESDESDGSADIDFAAHNAVSCFQDAEFKTVELV